jgi:hypothetical protein
MNLVTFLLFFFIFFITKDLFFYLKWYLKLKEKNIEIDSKIISKNITYKKLRTKVPVVEYNYNSNKYKSEVIFSVLGGGFYFFKVGENKKIFIDPNNPSKCIIKSNYLLTVNLLTVFIFYLLTIVYLTIKY